MKNNAAIQIYWQEWIKMIATLPMNKNAENWHAGVKMEDGPLLEMSTLAWQDLNEAIAQYRIWQNKPRYEGASREIVWREENAKLLDFGGEGAPILMVPSMINGHEVFHMPSDASMVSFFKAHGFHPFVLDWGIFDKTQSQASLEDFQTRLKNAAKWLKTSNMIGYCLGGTLAHLTNIPEIKRQVLIGTPWQFNHDQGRAGLMTKALRQMPRETLEKQFDALTQIYGCCPSAYLDLIFALLNPLQLVEKFRDRATRTDVTQFDAIEDWLNSGRHLPAPLAKTLILDWFRDDILEKSNAQTKRDTLAIFGLRDHIAPPRSCESILKTGDHIRAISYNGGHVGLLLGNHSRQQIWPQIIEFLNSETK